MPFDGLGDDLRASPGALQHLRIGALREIPDRPRALLRGVSARPRTLPCVGEPRERARGARRLRCSSATARAHRVLPVYADADELRFAVVEGRSVELRKLHVQRSHLAVEVVAERVAVHLAHGAVRKVPAPHHGDEGQRRLALDHEARLLVALQVVEAHRAKRRVLLGANVAAVEVPLAIVALRSVLDAHRSDRAVTGEGRRAPLRGQQVHRRESVAEARHRARGTGAEARAQHRPHDRAELRGTGEFLHQRRQRGLVRLRECDAPADGLDLQRGKGAVAEHQRDEAVSRRPHQHRLHRRSTLPQRHRGFPERRGALVGASLVERLGGVHPPIALRLAQLLAVCYGAKCEVFAGGGEHQ